MTPFHEVNPISYQEFLTTIMDNIGLTSYSNSPPFKRGSTIVIPRIPTEESPYNPGMSSLTKIKKGKEEGLMYNVTEIINDISWQEMGDPQPPNTSFFNPAGGYKARLGWSLYIAKDKKTDLVNRITILYLFREGLPDQEPPDNEDDYYNLGKGEFIGWTFEFYGIHWDEKNHVDEFSYQGGIILLGNHFNSFSSSSNRDWIFHSLSPSFLKRVFESNHFSDFLNWNRDNPLEVKQ